MNLRMIDYENPVEIADDIFWVGYKIEGDSFQCHTYLIKNGKDSILLDPGSNITWNKTREKIRKLIDLKDIKYFICHHQDPDITACMSDIFKEVGVENKFVITHWRTKALLVHYNWNVKFIEVESNNFKLDIAGRKLEFIFTPYMHFPGAICTYDTKTKTMFSSDIFGAFTDEFKLYADNPQDYFEQMKPFHEHYMPSKEIVSAGIERMEKYDINLIAPQHGSIIKKEFIPYIFKKLKQLDVGLFLQYGGYKNIRKLSKANEIFSDIINIIIYETDIFHKMDFMYNRIRKILPIERIVALGFRDGAFVFDSSLSYPIKVDIRYEVMIKKYKEIIFSDDCKIMELKNIADYDFKDNMKVCAFPARNSCGRIMGILFFVLEKDSFLRSIDFEILSNLKKPFEAMLNKELDFYATEEEKAKLLETSIKDELTTLYNRHYFNLLANKEFKKALRYKYTLSVAFLDIDHFKIINDTYGHNVGDAVLRHFSKLIIEKIRESDLAFRYGGEEFVLLFPNADKEKAIEILNRIKKQFDDTDGFNILDRQIGYTFSAGVVQLDNEKDIFELVNKADAKMYEAKQSGRDRIMS